MVCYSVGYAVYENQDREQEQGTCSRVLVALCRRDEHSEEDTGLDSGFHNCQIPLLDRVSDDAGYDADISDMYSVPAQ